MQWSPPIPIPVFHVSTMLHKEPCKIYMTLGQCPMQQSLPIPILVYHVGALLYKELCEIQMTLG